MSLFFHPNLFDSTVALIVRLSDELVKMFFFPVDFVFYTFVVYGDFSKLDLLCGRISVFWGQHEYSINSRVFFSL